MGSAVVAGQKAAYSIFNSICVLVSTIKRLFWVETHSGLALHPVSVSIYTRMEPDTKPGAKCYSPLVLSFYDIWILNISNSKAWRCPKSLQLEQYNALVGQKHLDVGVGTGWYLMRTTFPPHADITLFDLNSNALKHTKKRLALMYEPNLRAVVGDVYSPTGLDDIKPFDSIGMSYLLHCLPGTMKEKSLKNRSKRSQ